MSKYRLLFTTLPTNDLGLPTRALPIAKELSERGHSIVFSNPARAPKKLIEEAGFQNISPKHPLYELGFSKRNLRKLLFSKAVKKEYGGFFPFILSLVKSIPYKSAPPGNEIWDIKLRIRHNWFTE
jgi:hypothetical protein